MTPASSTPGALFVRGARQLLTLRGPAPRRGLSCSNLGVIRDGSLLIEDGLIAEVGSTRRIENLRKARAARLIDVRGKVVTPGLIDANIRLGVGPPMLQMFEQRIAGLTSVSASEVPTERAGGREDRWERARRWLRLAASTGATTVEVRSGDGATALQELRALRATSSLNGDPIEVLVGFSATLYGDPALPAFERIQEVLRKGAFPLRVASGFDLDGDGPNLDQPFARRLLDFAGRHGYRTSVQADADRPNGGVRLAVDVGAHTVERLEAVTEKDIELLAGSDTIGALLPNVAYHLGGGRFPPARQLLDRGAAVSIASGFSPDDRPGFGLPLAMALSCREMRLMPEEAITCCTINAAAGVGQASRIGSLEPNKEADLAVFDVGDYREIPYFLGANLCLMTVKRGRIVYRAGAQASRPAPLLEGA